MTREEFIRKGLANRDYIYNQESRDLMRDDLDKVIDKATQSPDKLKLPLDIEI